MVLIVGGSAQGKLAWAQRHLGVLEWSDGEIAEANCIIHLQNILRTDAGEEALLAYLNRFPQCVLICDEVGCGVVPMEKEERLWREKVGRVCCELAARAEAVYRVYCGLGEKIK